MKKICLFLTIAILYSVTGSKSVAQDISAAYSRYENIESLTKDKMIHGYITPGWIGKTGNFWYNVLTGEGMKYYIVTPEKKQKREAFSYPRLVSSLLSVQGKTETPEKPEMADIQFTDDLRSFTFTNSGYRWTCLLPSYKITKGEVVNERRRPEWYMYDENGFKGKPADSPDGKYSAFIENYNVCVKEKETGKTTQISTDGGLGMYYSSYIIWSPDSKKVMSCLVRPAEKHMINYIESSPKDQVQPKYSSIEYTKPGDALNQMYPRLFDVENKKMISQCDEMIPNQYSLVNFEWRKDSRSFTFEYNKRGHQLYQVIKLSADGAAPQILINETSETFIDYSSKLFRYDVNDGKEIIWASERDGWHHLYLYDGLTGKVINQITKGEWVVRNVVDVDEESRTILFTASGKEPGDPYLIHYYRINFNGTNLVHLTPGDGNHIASFSPDNKYFTDTWSRVDLPPVTILRDAKTGTEIMELEKADISSLLATGWTMPEVFSSKGRDGKTDIWGVILRPSNFDPSKSYPVIEYIYAGPHGSHVPKNFSAYYDRCRQSLTELGFIVVMIDGMGTSNRSKAFHDVCWKNLKDAGFPDRIIWIKEAAKKYPYMDISNVGIYGKSAGGQNSTTAVLFHPEFYKVAVSVCGCQDNRMDKIWWNEQWMGWPVGPQYSESSNVDNAYRLKGDLFLIVGEMDDNVDPASTYQVVNALIRANKTFDLLTLPGLKHEWGGKYGERRVVDYFVKKIMKKDPPPMNTSDFGNILEDESIAN